MDMVTQVTNFGRNGVSNWLIQRFTSVVMLAYFLCVACFFVCNDNISYELFNAYFSSTPMTIFSTAALLAIIAHAWIGLWAVSTDYLTTRMMGNKGTVLRLLFQTAYSSVLFIYLVWGLKILWG
ncbi:MAG: succinate dehydrogenase, hydrophobic membrane anchor protein [Cellvibrionales bacterium]|nr:succinate dehydrogenase, hydrophobic membrane anchor protein [Cellvibrionales bacterium]